MWWCFELSWRWRNQHNNTLQQQHVVSILKKKVHSRKNLFYSCSFSFFILIFHLIIYLIIYKNKTKQKNKELFLKRKKEKYLMYCYKNVNMRCYSNFCLIHMRSFFVLIRRTHFFLFIREIAKFSKRKRDYGNQSARPEQTMWGGFRVEVLTASVF